MIRKLRHPKVNLTELPQGLLKSEFPVVKETDLVSVNNVLYIVCKKDKARSPKSIHNLYLQEVYRPTKVLCEFFLWGTVEPKVVRKVEKIG
jgi:hypothetical protein